MQRVQAKQQLQFARKLLYIKFKVAMPCKLIFQQTQYNIDAFAAFQSPIVKNDITVDNPRKCLLYRLNIQIWKVVSFYWTVICTDY